jgi:type II secretory ATPase GspE/PulE/Tfp pilus assembly ATPase PilB-like protein
VHNQLADTLSALDPADAQYAARFVDALLDASRQHNASDVHLQPAPAGLELRWRIDGVLLSLGTISPGVTSHVVTRLKVLADLLTYRTDVPQEGRIRAASPGAEVRVSTFPTLDGERAVIRLFDNQLARRSLEKLGLPEETLSSLKRLLGATSGAILVTGPAGSGKTTTIYACLEELVGSRPTARSIVTVEDPIEMAIPGVAQSQVSDHAGFDLATALRGVLRQDPEVIMIGEIRDASTAEAALQAALTGQLILSSFHAGSAVEAISRLLEMGIEPYVLRSGLQAILFQRLVRRLCDCAHWSQGNDERLGLEVDRARVAVGCDACAGTGYSGRAPLTEMLIFDDGPLAEAVLARADKATLERLASHAGLVDRWSRAAAAVEAGITSPAEVRRVLGFSRKSEG